MSTPTSFKELDAIARRRDAYHAAALALEREADAMLERRTAERTGLLHTAAAHAEDAFSPPPRVRAQLIQDFCADATLGELASAAGTSLEHLCLWLARPEIQERIDAIRLAMALKLELTTLNKSTAMLGAVASIIEQFHEYESALGCMTGSDADKRATLRNRESVLRAISLALRLPHTARDPASPARPPQRGGRPPSTTRPSALTPTPPSASPHQPTAEQSTTTAIAPPPRPHTSLRTLTPIPATAQALRSRAGAAPSPSARPSRATLSVPAAQGPHASRPTNKRQVIQKMPSPSRLGVCPRGHQPARTATTTTPTEPPTAPPSSFPSSQQPPASPPPPPPHPQFTAAPVASPASRETATAPPGCS